MARPRTPSAGPPRAGEVYFEHITLGAYARVNAIDAATGIEVTVMGPVNSERRLLELTALRKLQLRLKRDMPQE